MPRHENRWHSRGRLSSPTDPRAKARRDARVQSCTAHTSSSSATSRSSRSTSLGTSYRARLGRVANCKDGEEGETKRPTAWGCRRPRVGRRAATAAGCRAPQERACRGPGGSEEAAAAARSVGPDAGQVATGQRFAAHAHTDALPGAARAPRQRQRRRRERRGRGLPSADMAAMLVIRHVFNPSVLGRTASHWL